MGNLTSDECPAEVKNFIPADVLEDLKAGYKAIAAKAVNGRTWDDSFSDRVTVPAGCRGVLGSLVRLQRGRAPAGLPSFASFCQGFHSLFTDLDPARRAAMHLRLTADAEVVNLECYFSSMVEYVGQGESRALLEAIAAVCELEDKLLVTVPALTRIVMETFHGLTAWLQVFASSAYLGSHHPLTEQARLFLRPPFDGPSQFLSPGLAAALALAMPQWVEPAARAHSARPRPHPVDVRRPFPGGWRLLFDSQRDGRSINSLVHSVVGYAGPTLLFVSTAAGDAFGAYVPLPWVESAEFQGNADCFLFTTKPVLRFILAAGGKGNFMYCNATLKSKEKHLERGLGFGGRVPYFRLYIDPELRSGRSTDFCATFTRGRITTSDTFEIEALEVWGCGDAESLTRLRTYQSTISAEVLQGKKVDRRAMFGEGDWRESTDATILQLAGRPLHSLELVTDHSVAEGEQGGAIHPSRVLPVG